MKHFLLLQKQCTCHIKVIFWNEKEAKKFFQRHPFYNALIEKPHIKHLKNIDLLYKFPFYDELSIEKISKAFKGYASSYKTETIDLEVLLA